MDILLNNIEVRILGSLLEKSMTTPEYYPLSLAALTNACNQKSNRHPVLSLDPKTVVRGIDALKEKQLAVQSDAGRVPKYSEILTSRQKLVAREAALLMVLMLRGPQTIGELRARTERASKFDNLEEVEKTLEDLIEAGYITQLSRQPGRKESRYAHLLAGEQELEPDLTAQPEQAAMEVMAENERIAALEAELAELRTEVAGLRREFETFTQQFE